MLSKGLTAGVLPLSAVLTTDAIYALFDADYAAARAFLHSNTYTGNALGGGGRATRCSTSTPTRTCWAGWPRAGRGCARRWRSPRGAPVSCATCARCGMVAAVDIRAADGSPLRPGPRTGYAVYREAVRRGALLRPLGDTMYLFPPLTVTRDELDEMAAILGDSLDAVVGAP